MSLILDLKHTLKAFKKYLWIVIIFFISGCIISFYNASSHGLQYTASTSFIVGANVTQGAKIDYYAYAVSHQLVNTCGNLVTSNRVLSDAVKISGVKTSSAKLSSTIQTKLTQNSDYIEMDVTADSNADAITLSNSIVKSMNNLLANIDTAIPLQVIVIDKPFITASTGGKIANIKAGLLGGIAGIFVALVIILILTAIKTKDDMAEKK